MWEPHGLPSDGTRVRRKRVRALRGDPSRNVQRRLSHATVGGGVYAMSAVCTHAGCLIFDAAGTIAEGLRCPCHGSTFNGGRRRHGWSGARPPALCCHYCHRRHHHRGRQPTGRREHAHAAFVTDGSCNLSRLGANRALGLSSLLGVSQVLGGSFRANAAATEICVHARLRRMTNAQLVIRQLTSCNHEKGTKCQPAAAQWVEICDGRSMARMLRRVFCSDEYVRRRDASPPWGQDLGRLAFQRRRPRDVGAIHFFPAIASARIRSPVAISTATETSGRLASGRKGIGL